MTTATHQVNAPAHVPPHLIYDFDIYKAPEKDRDPHAQFTWIANRDLPDIFWTPANGGHWVVTRSEEFNKVLTEPTVFSSWVNVVPESRSFKQIPINLDPPDHTKFRALLNPSFSPKAVATLGEKARQMTIDLIEKMQANGGCEFVDEFARQLPIGIFMNMVALPEADREMLLRVVDSIVRPTEIDDNSAFYELIAYATKTWKERLENPGDDLFSKLIQAKVDDQPLDEQSIIGIFTLLLIGGLDTVASVLGFVANFLAKNPGHRKLLIEQPALIPGAVEELLRRFPISTLVRKVVSDTQLKEVHMRNGDLIMLHSAAQTLDDRVFPDPMKVDFTRKTVFHGAFGNGAHRCVGSMLARTELKIFLEEWLKRIPDFELDTEKNWQLASGMVLTVEKLWLSWDVK
ncbi:cytochrome P450 [Herminiimonas arsenitoxidans]|uniref:cytochrome P450 n=1 Tax=Herminiimonas arsenitoxidans TaxID=1809410 RepID=UPI0009707F63|nr:cytochrome P450 [Herminiimonas arsenitoxidans]